MKNMRFTYYLVTIFLLSMNISCSSYKQFRYITEEFEIPTKIFKADYTQAWQAVLLVMKNYDLEFTSQESGVIKTRWISNTLELNFSDSFSRHDSVKEAKFKLIVNLVKGYRTGREVSKVTVFKRQLIEKDFLQGWKELPTDNVLEKTVLYRIERKLKIDNKLKIIEQQQSDEAEDKF